MLDPVLLIFTVEGEDLIRRRGWSGYWPVNPERAKGFKYVLFCQNLRRSKVMKEEWDSFATGTKPHCTGFLLARIADVVPANQLDPSPNVKDRWILTLSDAAEVDLPKLWKGWRYSAYYQHTLQDLGLDPDKLSFEPMPSPVAVETADATQTVSLSELAEETKSISESDGPLADIRRYAASRLGVQPNEVEISITLLTHRSAA